MILLNVPKKKIYDKQMAVQICEPAQIHFFFVLGVSRLMKSLMFIW